MQLDKETQDKLQELQLAEQNFQNLSLQKQAFQAELNETTSALEEVKKSEADMYKIIGQVMVKAKKSELIKELEERKKIIELRVKTIDKQEALFQKKAEEIKKVLDEKLKNNKK